ncbi:hypothetical protein KC19_VG084600 [Ceratodon purpureus]|uniref:Uncharacterized protein n=1 Tax=Ceratodon purpureus TaxID=3225 RepID=A0A8T0HND0_CERPU|nr:hypothetical protein KC19_VG084600 [Ceratodon purpureus]
MRSFFLENADILEPYRLQYAEVTQERANARQQWRSRHYARAGARAPNFPPHLSEIQPFPEWLRDTVQAQILTDMYVDEMVEAISKFPLLVAKKYCSLYSYGYHLRVQSAEEHLKTCDSGIAGTFIRACRAGVGDRNIVVAPVEYVGSLDEIIELDYGIFTQVVLVALWIKANYRGTNATMKRDRWGFTLANFNKIIDFGEDSFALPSHVQQVFFSDCSETPEWRVVIRTEPRGRRVVASATDREEGQLFQLGRDDEFEGLQIPVNISEDLPPRTEEGRVLLRKTCLGI